MQYTHVGSTRQRHTATNVMFALCSQRNPTPLLPPPPHEHEQVCMLTGPCIAAVSTWNTACIVHATYESSCWCAFSLCPEGNTMPATLTPCPHTHATMLVAPYHSHMCRTPPPLQPHPPNTPERHTHTLTHSHVCCQCSYCTPPSTPPPPPCTSQGPLAPPHSLPPPPKLPVCVPGKGLEGTDVTGPPPSHPTVVVASRVAAGLA
jgi:hypothetical protein